MFLEVVSKIHVSSGVPLWSELFKYLNAVRLDAAKNVVKLKKKMQNVLLLLA